MKNILLLQNRYIPILFIFAALVIFRFFYMSDIVHKNQYDGRIMNLSGKQRMYSQRSLVAAQAYFIDKTEQNKNIYISTLEQTDENRELFQNHFSCDSPSLYHDLLLPLYHGSYRMSRE